MTAPHHMGVDQLRREISEHLHSAEILMVELDKRDPAYHELFHHGALKDVPEPSEIAWLIDNLPEHIDEDRNPGDEIADRAHEARVTAELHAFNEAAE